MHLHFVYLNAAQQSAWSTAQQHLQEYSSTAKYCNQCNISALVSTNNFAELLGPRWR